MKIVHFGSNVQMVSVSIDARIVYLLIDNDTCINMYDLFDKSAKAFPIINTTGQLIGSLSNDLIFKD